MSRSLKKGPYVAYHLQEKIDKANASSKKTVIKTTSRNSMITPEFVGHTIAVHNGKAYFPVVVTADMIGHYLGEFANTRTYKGHTTKNKK